MLELLILIGRAVTLACRGLEELVPENMGLRQQLSAVKRTTKRPHLSISSSWSEASDLRAIHAVIVCPRELRIGANQDPVHENA